MFEGPNEPLNGFCTTKPPRAAIVFVRVWRRDGLCYFGGLGCLLQVSMSMGRSRRGSVGHVGVQMAYPLHNWHT